MKNTLQKTFIELLPDFKQYWKNNCHSKNSVSSYLSYIRGAARIFSSPDSINNPDIINFLQNEKIVSGNFTKFNKTTQSIKLLFAIVVKESNNFLSKKTKSNYLSGITAYFNFLFTRGYQFKANQSINSSIKRVLKIAKSNLAKSVYRHSEISSNFNTRLNTQDRVYEHLCFPICLINQIIGLDKQLTKQYRKIKKEKRESTKFLIEKGSQKSIPLSSITLLSIVPNKKCEITINSGEKYQIYTEAHPFDKTMYEELPAIDIRDLSIDHDTPFKTLFEENYNSYQTFIELGHRISAFFEYYGNDLKEIRDKIVNINATTAKKIIHKQDIDLTFATSLYKELENLYSQMEYTIMFGPYNSKKSDND